MQPHLLVSQLRFTRSEFVRCLEGVSEADAIRRIMPMNCISWMVGHLANQVHRYWVVLAQQKEVAPGLNELAGYGKPASTPPLKEMWAVWRQVTAEADEYLATLTPEIMQKTLLRNGKPVGESIGTLLMRNIYHYWYHTCEASAVRQMLGHAKVPEFVGDMSAAAYQPEE
ncbi:MAG: DinB family protein [Chloroflexi bacterium]|nr:DinB family protein [Chloroflexota bacterium]